MFKVTFKGAPEAVAFLTKASPALREAVKKSLKQAAILVKADAIYRVPVRTGVLRKSISYRVNSDEMGFTVGASAPYAAYIEYGTRYMRAQPFIRPSFISVMTNLKSAVSSEIETEIAKI